MGLNCYIPISESSLFQFVRGTGTDPTVHGRVQTDTVTDSRLVITQMGNVNQVVRLDGKGLTVQVYIE